MFHQQPRHVRDASRAHMPPRPHQVVIQAWLVPALLAVALGGTVLTAVGGTPGNGADGETANDSAEPTAQPKEREPRDLDTGMMGDGMMGGGGMMDGNMMRDMQVIRSLLNQHDKIERTVEDVPGGVRTVTTSDDPEVTGRIRRHVWQMKQRIEKGTPIRRMDPVFRELFKHHEKIEMRIEEVPDGVRVIETSDDPGVSSLIRQHARRFVSEAVEQGMPRAMRPTPLPEGYTTDRDE